MPNPLCLLPVLAGKRLAEEGIPTILWAPKPSLWSQSSSHIYTHTCLYRPGFRALPGAPTQACPHANSAGCFHSQGLQPGSRALAPCSLLYPPAGHVAWASAPFLAHLPVHALCPQVAKLEEASSNAFSFPSLPVHSLHMPPPPHLKV